MCEQMEVLADVRARLGIVGFVLVLTTAAAVRADVCPAPEQASPTQTECIAPVPVANLPATEAPAAATAVKELPAGPASATLFLGAVVSMGAWQLGRSTRKLHLGPVPEWYHAGGPTQVRHASPFELNSPALAACLFDRPVEASPPWHYLRRPTRLRGEPQYLPSLGAPRAPPEICL